MKIALRLLLLVGVVMLAITLGGDVQAVQAETSGPGLVLTSPLAPYLLPPAQGCSGNPQLTFYYANPATINPGQITTLYWGLVSNADSAYLQTPGSTFGIATPGSYQVNPTQTTTYYVVGNCGSNQVKWPITVNVTTAPVCSGLPVFNGFSANPTSIQSGQSSTLSWGPIYNADYISFAVTGVGSAPASAPATFPVKPTQTTTYVLTAWCQGASAALQATVTVNNAPPTPTPAPSAPPPSQGNAITGMSKNGGLTSSSALVMTVNYYWTGEDAPATLQGTAFNSAGGIVSVSNATTINAQQNFYANLNFPGPSDQMVQVVVCMNGASGTPLVCATGKP